MKKKKCVLFVASLFVILSGCTAKTDMECVENTVVVEDVASVIESTEVETVEEVTTIEPESNVTYEEVEVASSEVILETDIETELEQDTILIQQSEVPMEETTVELEALESQVAVATPVETIPAVEVVAYQDGRLLNALDKIARLESAYIDLMNSNDYFSYDLQMSVENLDFHLSRSNNTKTANGESINGGYTMFAILSHYYDNYVNYNGNYYNLNEWVSTQYSNDSIVKTYLPTIYYANSDTNNNTMFEAIRCVLYLTTLENMTLGEVVETTNYVVSGTPSAYAIPILNNGLPTGMTAVFDSNNRMLNICTEPTFDNFYYSFDNGVIS